MIPALTFAEWVDKWNQLASYKGEDVPNPESRTEEIIRLWKSPIPPGWQRNNMPERLHFPTPQYSRGDQERPTGPERLVEKQLFDIQAASNGHVAYSTHSTLILLANAYPVAQNPKIESDIVAFHRGDSIDALFVIEVKSGADNAWYALVENIRQLRLFLEHIEFNWQFLRTTFSQFLKRTHSQQWPDKPLPLSGMVLAPTVYFFQRGKKANATGPAKRLALQFKKETGHECALVEWGRVMPLMLP